jgi:hypothetical protein
MHGGVTEIALGLSESHAVLNINHARVSYWYTCDAPIADATEIALGFCPEIGTVSKN